MSYFCCVMINNITKGVVVTDKNTWSYINQSINQSLLKCTIGTRAQIGPMQHLHIKGKMNTHEPAVGLPSYIIFICETHCSYTLHVIFHRDSYYYITLLSGHVSCFNTLIIIWSGTQARNKI